jgi:hypothetical protein
MLAEDAAMQGVLATMDHHWNSLNSDIQSNILKCKQNTRSLQSSSSRNRMRDNSSLISTDDRRGLDSPREPLSAKAAPYSNRVS